MTKTPEQRFNAKVEREDGGCWLWTAYVNTRGYGLFWHDGRSLMAHRFSYEAFVGEISAGEEIDHICHVRNCVNPSHLQVVTRVQNAENLAGARSDSRTGVRGVYQLPRDGKWVAYAKHLGRQYHGGCFTNLDDARDAAAALRNSLMSNNRVDRQLETQETR